jgi:diadenosine tetraphosphate (Ap4A) HIT family hydrolase
MSCSACDRLERIARNADPEFVATLSECQVVLADEQLYRGYCILFLRDHAEHLADLSLDRQGRVWDDVARVAAAVRKTVEPLRLNYASLGNFVTHVHWHVIPRHADDPEPLHPIWVRSVSERRVALSEDRRRALIADLRRAMGV